MQKNKSTLFSLLKPYKGLVLFLAVLSMAASGLGLLLPKIISKAIDTYLAGTYQLELILMQFGVIILAVYVLTYLQSIVQTFASEKVAKDLRQELIDKISKQEFAFIQEVSAAKLLTNLTADIDSIKMFVGRAIAMLISAVIVLIGAAGFLLSINWKLALVVLGMMPIIGIMFFIIFSRVKDLITKSREIIDRLNKVINESILGSTLIRVLNLQKLESYKFIEANIDAKDLGIKILKMFAALIPIISFVANLAVVAILVFGGNFVINGQMSLGDFTAFNSYLALLIFPIVIIGIMSSMLAQAASSYERVSQILNRQDPKEDGSITDVLKGKIEVKNLELAYEDKKILKNISFTIEAGHKVAIIGPTAAGKTQLLNVLIGLTQADAGLILYDGKSLKDYNSESLHKQIGFVFQDSVLFNLSLRQNIAFGGNVSQKDMSKALETAELGDFVESLPLKLETIVSERGMSLSGGQKQRIMLARALALNPKILILDDFTARLDAKTEAKIIKNIEKNYPKVTLLSVTQKIAAIENYNKVIVLMEGELIAEGTHAELMASSPEYVQIYNSQQSLNQYE